MYVVYFRAYIILRAHATLRRGALSSLATFAAVFIKFPRFVFRSLAPALFAVYSRALVPCSCVHALRYLLPYLLPSNVFNVHSIRFLEPF